MYKRNITLLYALNIMFQAIFTLLINIGLGILLSRLAVTYWGADGWIYAPLVTVGVITGLFSMIKFLLSAMRTIETLEEQHRQDERKAKADALRAHKSNQSSNGADKDEDKNSEEV